MLSKKLLLFNKKTNVNFFIFISKVDISSLIYKCKCIQFIIRMIHIISNDKYNNDNVNM